MKFIIPYMGRKAGKSVVRFSRKPDTDQAVQPRWMAADLNFRIVFELCLNCTSFSFYVRFRQCGGCTIYVAKTLELNIRTVAVWLICALCFFYICKMQICHDEAHRAFDFTKGVKLYGLLG